MYCIREIDLIGIFPLCLLDDYGLGNQLAEVVHGKLCKDFPENELHLFCVQVQKSQRMLQIAERSFNAPAHRVKYLYILQWESGFIQIRNNGFTSRFGDREANDSERNVIELGGVMLS